MGTKIPDFHNFTYVFQWRHPAKRSNQQECLQWNWRWIQTRTERGATGIFVHLHLLERRSSKQENFLLPGLLGPCRGGRKIVQNTVRHDRFHRWCLGCRLRCATTHCVPVWLFLLCLTVVARKRMWLYVTRLIWWHENSICFERTVSMWHLGSLQRPTAAKYQTPPSWTLNYFYRALLSIVLRIVQNIVTNTSWPRSIKNVSVIRNSALSHLFKGHRVYWGHGQKPKHGINSIEFVYLEDTAVLEKYSSHEKGWNEK